MTYHHLTYHDRILIGSLLELEKKVPEIALRLGRLKSTIYREIERNSYNGFYFYETAEILSIWRKSSASLDRCEDSENRRVD